jgi:hypothetical protein
LPLPETPMTTTARGASTGVRSLAANVLGSAIFGIEKKGNLRKMSASTEFGSAAR